MLAASESCGPAAVSISRGRARCSAGAHDPQTESTPFTRAALRHRKVAGFHLTMNYRDLTVCTRERRLFHHEGRVADSVC